MDPISIRYGESVTLPIDVGDLTANSADLFIGKPGELYVISLHIDLVDGKGVFVMSSTDTQIPLGTYSYQVNVIDTLGGITKYPSPEPGCGDCEDDFPQFVVCEALDSTEIS